MPWHIVNRVHWQFLFPPGTDSSCSEMKTVNKQSKEIGARSPQTLERASQHGTWQPLFAPQELLLGIPSPLSSQKGIRNSG